MSADGVTEESKRGRVRRLLIDPLESDGFRFSKRVDAKAGRAALDRIADDLAYMTDAGLTGLRVSLRTKGEGAQRCFWPAVATILGFAEAFEKRPLSELPALLRWFASVAGEGAQMGDRLVAEYWFWVQNKRPPVNDRDRKVVLDKADKLRRRVELARDRARRNALNDPDEVLFLRRYDERLAYVEGLVGKKEVAA
jgi:hypothetical protein